MQSDAVDAKGVKWYTVVARDGFLTHGAQAEWNDGRDHIKTWCGRELNGEGAKKGKPDKTKLDCKRCAKEACSA